MTGRVLIIDDSLSNIRLLEAILRAEFFEVLHTTSGPDALHLLTQTVPDLVLCDAYMPQQNGYATCAQIKALYPDLPVIMMTTPQDDAPKSAGIAAGVQGYISKPIDASRILARIRLVLREAQWRSLQDPQLLTSLSQKTALVGFSEAVPKALIDWLDQQGWAWEDKPRFDQDMIFVEIQTPPEPSLRQIAQLRLDPQTSRVPLIAILPPYDRRNPQQARATLARVLDLGVDDVLYAPLDAAELHVQCWTLYRRSQHTQALLQHRAILRQEDTTDALTGLYNRHYIDQALAHMTQECAHTSSMMGCLLVDIDKFAHINDTYGRAAGDEALRMVAQRLLRTVRPFDVVARWEGAEFMILLRPPQDNIQLARIAKRLQQTVCDTPLELPDGRLVEVKMSLGGTLGHAQSRRSGLYHAADQALYVAKHQGGHSIHIR